MKILNIIILILGIGGGTLGTNFIQKIKLNKIEKAHKKEINLKVDTIKTLRQNVRYIISQDSLKSELITQGQLVIKDLNRLNRKLKMDSTFQSAKIKDMAEWIEDAKDGVITDTVNIEYKTNIFGKRKRIK